MTQQAERIRTRRQAFAAPGGSLDRIVRWLAVGLPAAVGAIAAMMVIAPLSPRGEISFLLDRNKVAIAEDRLRVEDALYRGHHNRGRPFSISSGQAVQTSIAVPVVQMRDLTARILLSEGPAVLTARTGNYAIDDETVAIDGLVQFKAADGYSAVARDVSINLPQRTLTGDGNVDGAVPAGTFRADRMRADLEAHTITLDGNARLHMVPGQMRMPTP